jgi:hypothetical protein
MNILILTDESGDLDEETYNKIFVGVLKQLLQEAIKVENYELCNEIKNKIKEYES